MRSDDTVRLRHMARASAPQFPWRAVIGMRNRLIHGYFNVDPELVWKTVSRELPALVPGLKALLSKAD